MIEKKTLITKSISNNCYVLLIESIPPSTWTPSNYEWFNERFKKYSVFVQDNNYYCYGFKWKTNNILEALMFFKNLCNRNE